MASQMQKKISFKILILLALTFLMASCAEKTVTFNGKPVTHPALRNHALAIEGADLTIANITRFLILLDKTDRLPDEVLKTYSEMVVPVLRESIKTAKAALILSLREQSESNMAQINAAILTLEKALITAIGIARRYGW